MAINFGKSLAIGEIYGQLYVNSGTNFYFHINPKIDNVVVMDGNNYPNVPQRLQGSRHSGDILRMSLHREINTTLANFLLAMKT